MSESSTQQALMKWWSMAWRGLGLHDQRVLMAFPLQGKRKPRNGARMKAEGMRAGTPDMFLAVPRGTFHGLFLELKAKDGRLSPSQKEMMWVLGQSYAMHVAYGLDNAMDVITSYLTLTVKTGLTPPEL